jgi:hypothetical protein
MRDDQKRALLADGGKGEAVAQPVCWITREQLERVEDEGEDVWVYWAETGHVAEPDEVALYAAPQAECAPREAQPVEDMKISVVTEDKSPLEVKSIHYFAREIIVRVAAPQAECAPLELSCAYVELKKKAIQACEEVQRRSGGEKYNMFGKDLAEQCIEAIRRHCKEPK